MVLLRITLLSAIAYGLYRYVKATQNPGGALQRAAFADGESTPGVVDVRNAGPDAMASAPARHWDKTDQANDESYPASDPPSSNRFT